MSENATVAEFLNNLSEDLDIPDFLHEDAVLKYTDVGEWLGDSASELSKYEPEIYPQGSFRLGTVVKPLTQELEYDIDLVCRLNVAKDSITQDALKAMIGDRLNGRDDLKKMLRPSRRCWEITYPKQFHMDVLPAISNADDLPTGILITDTNLRNWQQSNPIGYAEWFKEQMTVMFNVRKAELAKSMEADIEDVPEWQIKTPLQRVVQILKRHRDIHFLGTEDNKPVSIILTTLAARSYQNQGDIDAAFLGVITNMKRFIENRGGKWWVANPKNDRENFADKWNEKSARKDAFFAWLNKLEQDFSPSIMKKSLADTATRLSPILGESAVKSVSQKLGIDLKSISPGTIVPSPVVPPISDVSHVQKATWPENIQCRAKVKCVVHRKRKSTDRLWVLKNDKTVPKNVELKFTVETNVPKPYEVKWQVVNTGEEALNAKSLRGGFEDSDEGCDGRWESTAYLGTHWVQAFIVKQGVCIAKSDKRYIRIR